MFDEDFNFGDSFRFSKISVHPHVKQFISDPGGLHLDQSVDQPQGGNDTQHPHPPPQNQEDLDSKMLGESQRVWLEIKPPKMYIFDKEEVRTIFKLLNSNFIH